MQINLPAEYVMSFGAFFVLFLLLMAVYMHRTVRVWTEVRDELKDEDNTAPMVSDSLYCMMKAMIDLEIDDDMAVRIATKTTGLNEDAVRKLWEVHKRVAELHQMIVDGKLEVPENPDKPMEPWPGGTAPDPAQEQSKPD